MLLTRDNLYARLIQVIGVSHVSLTTRTLEESGRRISRYLMIFSAYNASYGVIIGLGLWIIGVPYAVLWGFLSAVLRYNWRWCRPSNKNKKRCVATCGCNRDNA